METKKILIAETSVDFCQRLTECMAGAYFLRVCHSGLEAQRLLEEFRPDVLVMDLALPELDGIALLKQIALEPDRPRVLLTTCLLSSYVETTIRSCAVDLVMVKPCDARIVADRICDLANERPDAAAPAPRKSLTVSDILLNLDISPKRKAFEYLQMSVELYAANPCQAVTKRLYPAVAEAYDTNPVALERAIRQVIHEAWGRRDEAVWRQYFRIDRSGNVPRPTNAEFISRLAEAQRRVAQ